MYVVTVKQTHIPSGVETIKDGNHYNLNEAKEYYNSKNSETHKYEIIKIEIVKHKVLICDSIVRHKFPRFDYYLDNSMDDIKYIIESLLAGPKEHIELYKLNGTWQEATDVVDVIPLLEEDYSIESILYHGYDILFPQSSFLSRYIVSLLHKYDDKEISKEDLLKIFDHINSLSFCDKQKSIVKALREEYIK